MEFNQVQIFRSLHFEDKIRYLNSIVYEKCLCEKQVVAQQNRLEELKKGYIAPDIFHQQTQAIFTWKARLMRTMCRIRSAKELLEETILFEEVPEGSKEHEQVLAAINDAKKILTDIP